MARSKQWEISPITDGVAEVKIISWRYFFNFIYKEMLDYDKFIWRGQRCDNWLLESTLDRLRKKTKITKTKRKTFNDHLLNMFKYSVRGRRGINPPHLETENDWWALGQHYGLATPLLDWTTSPFVAAYFAYINVGERQTKHRAIYALYQPRVEKLAKISNLEIDVQHKQQETELETKSPRIAFNPYSIPLRPAVEFIRPFSDENQRLVNQGGLFTRFPTAIDIQSWIEEKFKDENKTYILMKILVPNKNREEYLKSLNRMNINHLTLFPDLHGASKYCNLFGEIEKY
jgi:hypothetical protein